MLTVARAAIAIVSLVVCAAPPAFAGSIVGTWVGKGEARLVTGDVEPLRCRVRFTDGGKRTFVMNVSCSHAHGTLDQTGRVVARGNGTFTGRLYSDQYGAAGSVKIVMRNDRQDVVVESIQGKAKLVFKRI